SKRAGRSGKRTAKLKVTEVGERYAAYLLTAFVGLTLFGLVMVLSASSVSSLHQYDQSPFYQFKRQLIWAAIGAVAFVVTSRLDYRILRRAAGPLMLLCFVLLIVLLIPGVGINVNGSTRWLGYGPLVIQPSELTKLALIIFVADLLARRERRMDRPELTVRPVMVTVYAASALLLLQPKLGTPVILGGVAMIMLFIAGAKLRSLVAWTTFSAVAVVAMALATGYQRSRIDGWLNPWDSPQGVGLQAIQSQVGIASGGLFGVGLGAGRAKWGFLPFAQTDFIFAIVAEEIGLIGASALIAAFVLIAWMGVKAALAAPDRFGMLLAAGITSWLLVQAFLNIGMVLGVLPITGEALPFVSAGGSSLVTALAAAGLLTSVARRART
ncbi:MAG: putative lipid II flippase FtsW, partial [Actinomycetota bacterium]